MAKTALYAISGDPVTRGHMDITKRVAALFDKVYVGIAINPTKKYTFTMDERADLARQSFRRLPNVEVISYEGLTADEAYRRNVSAVIRGIRNVQDAAQDIDYAQFIRNLRPNIDAWLLPTSRDTNLISSSAAKELVINHGGHVEEFVTLPVKQKLEERLNKQYVIGVTGVIAAGKSTISRRFIELGQAQGISVHDIDMDALGKKILTEYTDEQCVNIREQIAQEFGVAQEAGTGYITDTKRLGSIVFNDRFALDKLNGYTHEMIITKGRELMRGKKGLMLINAALIVEMGLLATCNNNVVLATTDSKTQYERLSARGMTPEQITQRINSQYNEAQKRAGIQKSMIRFDAHGKTFEHYSGIHSIPGVDMTAEIFDAVVGHLNVPKVPHA